MTVCRRRPRNRWTPPRRGSAAVTMTFCGSEPGPATSALGAGAGAGAATEASFDSGSGGSDFRVPVTSAPWGRNGRWGSELERLRPDVAAWCWSAAFPCGTLPAVPASSWGVASTAKSSLDGSGPRSRRSRMADCWRSRERSCDAVLTRARSLRGCVVVVAGGGSSVKGSGGVSGFLEWEGPSAWAFGPKYDEAASSLPDGSIFHNPERLSRGRREVRCVTLWNLSASHILKGDAQECRVGVQVKGGTWHFPAGCPDVIWRFIEPARSNRGTRSLPQCTGATTNYPHGLPCGSKAM